MKDVDKIPGVVYEGDREALTKGNYKIAQKGFITIPSKEDRKIRLKEKQKLENLDEYFLDLFFMQKNLSKGPEGI